MTLTRHPSESPYVLGMEKYLDEVTDLVTKENLQDKIDTYVNEIEMLYFNIPNRSTFTYSVELSNVADTNSLKAATDYELFYRTDTEEKVLLTSADSLSAVENFNESYQNGYQAMEKLKSNLDIANLDTGSNISAKASFTYDRIAARDWAWDNYDEDPEFPSSTVSGTDCANFVSKALNAGGIPEDKSGKWYGAKTWGGWPGGLEPDITVKQEL